MSKTITREYLLRGRERSRQLGRAGLIDLLLRAKADWDHIARYTQWENGFTSTKGGKSDEPGTGKRREVPFGKYAAETEEYARSKVRAKKKGRCISHGLSRFGGSLDAECEARTMLFADADEVGGFHHLKAALDETGFAYVVQESGGSKPGKPRWHLELPLAAPLVPTADIKRWKDQHRAEYGFVLGVFSELADLSCSADGKVGFDPATDRLLQVMEVGSRRTTNAPMPATVWAEGYALDWCKLLHAAGYVPPPKKTTSAASAATRIASTGSPVVDGSALPLVKAFALDGLVTRPRDGKTDVICPWSTKHSTGTPGDTGTVIMHYDPEGVFHCSHDHCRRWRRRDVYRKLSAAAQALLDEAAGLRGRQRLREQLKAQRVQHEARKVVTLDGVEQAISEELQKVKPGELVLVVVPTGAGKSRACRIALGKRGHGIFAYPTHKLGDEVEADFAMMNTPVQRRRGVLSVRDATGNVVCKHPIAAAEIQKSGGSVPQLLCRRCPDRKQCIAGKPVGSGDIILLTHQLVLQTRARRPDELVIVDETPQLADEVVLGPQKLAEAEQLLAGEFLFDSFDLSFGLAMRIWIGILIATAGGTLSLTAAVASYKATPEGQKRLREGVGLGHPAQWLYDSSGSDKELLFHVLDMVTVFGCSRTETIQAATVGPTLAEVRHLSDSLLQRSSDCLRLLRPLRLAAEAVLDRGVEALRWRSRKLVVRQPTLVAQDLKLHGGVILDATPDLDELGELRPDLRVVELAVVDGATVIRRALYRPRASRAHLLKNKEPVWSRVRQLLSQALERVGEAEGQKLLVVSYKAVIEGLKRPTNPCADLLAEWVTDGGQIDFTHYHAQRGLNSWKEFDACVTIGDPWPDVESFGERAEELEVEHDEYLRRFAARELAQTHGRLRAPSRKAPAFLLHLGTVAPSDWHDGNAEVETQQAGRPPATPTEAQVTEVKAAVERLGGLEAAAGLAKCAARSLRRYVSGRRAAPVEILERLRGAARSDGGGGGPKCSS
jgi:hypothetical protein